MTSRALSLIALASCPESGSRPDAPLPPDVGELQCGTSGAAVVSGSVGDETLGPVMHVFQAGLNGARNGIGIDDTGAGAGCSPSTTMGHFLILLTCNSTLMTGVTELGGSIGTCPTEQSPGSATLLDTTNSTSVVAVSGTLMIDSIDAGCIKGSFITDWVNAQHLTGVFAALACP